MEEVSVIGVDLAKNVFELCALGAGGEVIWTRRLTRKGFTRFMADKAPRCLVGMEACGGAHHWGRWLTELGFTVKVMAPKAVKSYRHGPHKSDARDARAAGEAASRDYVRSVRVKSEAAQAVQALVRLRTLQIKQLIQTSNHLRGILGEFGVVLPKGAKRMREAIAALAEDRTWLGMPLSVRKAADQLCTQLADQTRQVRQATEDLVAATKDEDVCNQLRTVPGLGPINAASMSVALEAPHAFASARAFAASLRLVPRQHQSAEKNKLFGIARQSANETRRHLVLAGQSLITMVDRLEAPPNDGFLLWVWRMRQRKNRNVAAVAVAAKLSRIAWAIAAKQETYRPRSVKGSHSGPSLAAA
jgi:transposase